MIVKENLLNVMEHFFFYSVFFSHNFTETTRLFFMKVFFFWIFLRYLYRFFPHPHSKLRHFQRSVVSTITFRNITSSLT